MPLVTTTEMFKKAYDGGYAVGAFNVNNMEIVQGITEACQEQHAPVVLQVSKGARAYANHTYLVKMVEAAVIECPDIPIALHLDHGPDFETCKSCIDGGFTSVMIDCSSRPFDENVEETKKVVEYAHAHGVVVEAELGTLAGVEDDVKVSAEDSSYTHPEEVEEFVTRTGCDSLAIAIGTSHGAYKFTPEQSSVNSFGAVTVAGNTAAANIEGFVYISMNALYQTSISFTSQNLGAKNYHRIDQTLVRCMCIVTLIGLVLGNGAHLLGNHLLHIYSDDLEVISFGMQRLSVISVTYCLCGMMDVLAGTIRGLGYSMLPMIVSLIGACVFRIIWIFTVFRVQHTLFILYASYPISWILTILAHFVCYLIVRKKVFRPQET